MEPYRSLDLEPQRVVLAPWHDGLPTVVVDGSERRLIRGMVGLMEYQRQHCLLDGNSVVGGFIEMTSIARDRITRRIVHRWPDRVGEKISSSTELFGLKETHRCFGTTSMIAG